jgi:hypothetical protein
MPHRVASGVLRGAGSRPCRLHGTLTTPVAALDRAAAGDSSCSDALLAALAASHALEATGATGTLTGPEIADHGLPRDRRMTPTRRPGACTATVPATTGPERTGRGCRGSRRRPVATYAP